MIEDQDYAALAKQFGGASQPPPPSTGVDYAALAKANGATTSQPAPPPAPQGQKAAGATFGEKLANAARMLTDAAPAVGGMVGGYFGAVPGAIVGGAAGQGYKELADHFTELPGAVADVARNLIAHPVATAQGAVSGQNHGAVDATVEGLAQGAGQKGGELLAQGAGVMSKWLMNRATTRVSAKLLQDFPELSDTLIDNALTVSKGGYDRAYAMLMGAKAKANAALKLADAAGAKVPVELNPDLAESLKTALLERAVKSGRVLPPTPGQPLTAATARLDPTTAAMFRDIEAAATNGGSMELTPSQADVLKTQLQKESRALYANRTAPNGPKAMGMDATERAEYATQLNTAIDQLATGYKAANAEARPLIGAVRGLKQAIRPNGNLYQAMVRPAVGAVMGEETSRNTGLNPVVGGIIGAAATSPVNLSREAILLSHPAFQGALKQLPKPIASWLVDLISSQSAQQPPQGTDR